MENEKVFEMARLIIDYPENAHDTILDCLAEEGLFNEFDKWSNTKEDTIAKKIFFKLEQNELDYLTRWHDEGVLRDMLDQ